MPQTLTILFNKQSSLSWATPFFLLGTRVKHIDISIHYICDFVNFSMGFVQYISTEAIEKDIIRNPLNKVEMNQASSEVEISSLEDCWGPVITMFFSLLLKYWT